MQAEEAALDFRKKFRQKTLNNWDERHGNFEKVRGKYMLLDMADIEADNNIQVRILNTYFVILMVLRLKTNKEFQLGCHCRAVLSPAVYKLRSWASAVYMKLSTRVTFNWYFMDSAFDRITYFFVWKIIQFTLYVTFEKTPNGSFNSRSKCYISWVMIRWTEDAIVWCMKRHCIIGLLSLTLCQYECFDTQKIVGLFCIWAQ